MGKFYFEGKRERERDPQSVQIGMPSSNIFSLKMLELGIDVKPITGLHKSFGELISLSELQNFNSDSPVLQIEREENIVSQAELYNRNSE